MPAQRLEMQMTKEYLGLYKYKWYNAQFQKYVYCFYIF